MNTPTKETRTFETKTVRIESGEEQTLGIAVPCDISKLIENKLCSINKEVGC